MPIRGNRPIYPHRGEKPTGIFSTNGKQKQDGIGGPNSGVLKSAMAHTGKNGTSGKSAGGQGLRHQPPKK